MIPRYAQLLLIGLMLSAAPAFAEEKNTLRFQHMFVLGDSLSDQGNLFIATAELGQPLNLPPIPDAVRYYNGRFSNGENYAGLLAQKLGLVLTPSELGGTNYAFGGARTDYNRVESDAPLPLPPGPYPPDAFPWTLDSQRDAFLADAGRVADPKGLYVIFSGSNDLSDALTAALVLHQDPAPRIAKALQGIRNAVAAVKSAGARTILVPNLPNLGVVPSVTQFGPVVAGLATALSQQFNAALAVMLATDANVIEFDTFAFLTNVVAHPGDYGLTNVTQPCYSGYVEPDPNATVCADPEEYAFWDREHPTTRFHAILADELFASVLQCHARENGAANSASTRFTVRCAIDSP